MRRLLYLGVEAQHGCCGWRLPGASQPNECLSRCDLAWARTLIRIGSRNSACEPANFRLSGR